MVSAGKDGKRLEKLYKGTELYVIVAPVESTESRGRSDKPTVRINERQRADESTGNIRRAPGRREVL